MGGERHLVRGTAALVEIVDNIAVERLVGQVNQVLHNQNPDVVAAGVVQILNFLGENAVVNCAKNSIHQDAKEVQLRLSIVHTQAVFANEVSDLNH